MKRSAAVLSALAVILAAVSLARAQDWSDQASFNGIAGGFQRKMNQQAQAQRKRENENSQILNVLQQAKLSPATLASEGWSPDQIHSLALAILRGSLAVARLHEDYPSAVADAYKNSWWHLDAELTNLEQSAKAGIAEISGNARAKAAEFKRGCLAHQQAVFSALSGQNLPGVEVRKIMIGTGLEHHAVIVFPQGGDWSGSGVVLDGWLNQSSQIGKMTFPVNAWESNFKLLRVITPARLED
ncbi:MAG TPA: hypothetical protein VNH15_08300 [Elusimicrobiota bacterium]|nr:hypothetical protein [Elusimicrobiota bacterium]